jgi:hypothetical protein
MTRGIVAASAAIIALAWITPSMAQSGMQGGCWKSTDSTKSYGYYGPCPTPQRAARRPTRLDEKGAQANAMQVSSRGGAGQCWKSTDSTKMYGYWQGCPR